MPTLVHINVSARDDHSIFRPSQRCGRGGGQIAASDFRFLNHHSELERI